MKIEGGKSKAARAVRAVSLGLAAALIATACIDDPGAGGWTPPPKSVIDTSSDGVVLGRLWVTPNPIWVRPEWTDRLIGVQVENVGTADVIVDSIRVDGSTDFHFEDGGGPALGGFPFPLRMGGQQEDPDCSGASGIGFALLYQPEGGGDDARLVVATSDPTSPTLDVPIMIDWTGDHTPASDSDDDPLEGGFYVRLHPNPIRMRAPAAGETTTLEACIRIAPWGYGEITHIRAWPPELRITGVVDYFGTPVDPDAWGYGPIDPAFLTLELSSPAEGSGSGDSMDSGLLAIGLSGEEGWEMDFVVPVIVR